MTAKKASKQKPKAKPKTARAKPKAAAAAKRKRLSPADYAWASHDSMLGGDTNEHRDEGPDRRVYLQRGREFAALTREGDEIVIDFEAPKSMAEKFAKVKRFYAPVPGRRGWLRFRRPATQDPRPGLEADLGSILGTAEYERNPPPVWRSIASGGGPYVCMQLSDVGSWGGVVDADEFPEEAALYERALRGPDTASILKLTNGRSVLVLGTPDPLFGKTTKRGGIFARAVAHSVSDEELLALLDRAPADDWETVGEMKVTEPVRAFDVATFGGAIGEGNSITLKLAPRSYHVSCRTWKPDADTELLLTRFA